LHCDKISPFGHIEAAPLELPVLALIVSGDNGLKGCGEFDAARRPGALQGAYQQLLPTRTLQTI
jgi:hypothetical protein